jgi:hypothetical protein
VRVGQGANESVRGGHYRGRPEGLVASIILARARLTRACARKSDEPGGRATTLEFHPGFRASLYADELPPMGHRLYRNLGLAQRGAILAPSPASVAFTDAGTSVLFANEERLARSAAYEAAPGVLALRRETDNLRAPLSGVPRSLPKCSGAGSPRTEQATHRHGRQALGSVSRSRRSYESASLTACSPAPGGGCDLRPRRVAHSSPARHCMRWRPELAAQVSRLPDLGGWGGHWPTLPSRAVLRSAATRTSPRFACLTDALRCCDRRWRNHRRRRGALRARSQAHHSWPRSTGPACPTRLQSALGGFEPQASGHACCLRWMLYPTCPFAHDMPDAVTGPDPRCAVARKPFTQL